MRSCDITPFREIQKIKALLGFKDIIAKTTRIWRGSQQSFYRRLGILLLVDA
ncbi:hypothetical protein [Nostoc sp.]|uniref:hypothetical protein n=1 Tax=Nostoc sp. TaxID=1180 RepID=UPI002FFC0012